MLNLKVYNKLYNGVVNSIFKILTRRCQSGQMGLVKDQLA